MPVSDLITIWRNYSFDLFWMSTLRQDIFAPEFIYFSKGPYGTLVAEICYGCCTVDIYIW